jgi:hypothetical protein
MANQEQKSVNSLGQSLVLRRKSMANSIYFNGVNGVTGEYLLPPLDYERAVEFVKGETTDPLLVRYLRRIWRTISRPGLGLAIDVDPADVSQAGWAVVFHTDEAAAVKDALMPLVEHRRAQIGKEKTKILEYPMGKAGRTG